MNTYPWVTDPWTSDADPPTTSESTISGGKTATVVFPYATADVGSEASTLSSFATAVTCTSIKPVRAYRGDLGVTTVSGKVSLWADQSGNGNDASQSTAGLRPTFNASNVNFNGAPTVDWDGVDDTMVSVAASAQPNTVVICARNEGSNAAYHALCDGSSANQRLLRVEVTSQNFIAYAGATLTDGVWATNAKHKVAGVFNGSSGAVRSDSSTTTGDVSTGSSTGFTLGSNGAGSIPWQGPIAEVLMYDVALTSAQLDVIIAYFTGRYG